MAKDKPIPAGPAAEPAPAAPTPPATFEEIHRSVIREKTIAGLTKDQAIEVVKAQLAHDAALAAAAAPAK